MNWIGKNFNYFNMEKKTGKEWFDTLSELEQKQFKENCDRFDFMMESKQNFMDFISGAFSWANTPKEQGFLYWEKISTR